MFILQNFKYAHRHDLAGFPPRLGEHHRQHAHMYNSLEAEERDEYFHEHAARWFELSRLAYFDPVRMSILDPMHNILLGESRCCVYLI